MNKHQIEMDQASGCEVYIVVDGGTEVGRILRDIGPDGDTRWRIQADAAEVAYDRVEDAARACIRHARARDRDPHRRIDP